MEDSIFEHEATEDSLKRKKEDSLIFEIEPIDSKEQKVDTKKAKKTTQRENFKVDDSVWKPFLEHKTSFAELKNLYNELKDTTSTKNKKRILSKHPECVKGLLAVYHPYKHYQVTIGHIRNLLGTHLSKNPRTQWVDREGNYLTVPSDIYELMDYLDERRVTGNDAIDMVISFIKSNMEYKNLILEMLDKDLKIHCNVKTINSVFTDLIPFFPVALAERYEEKGKNIDFKNEDWFWSRKYDGVRLLTFIQSNGTIEFRSRQGNSFFTLKVLENHLKEVSWPKGYVIDGEVCVMDQGLENFIRIVSDIKQKGHTIPSPKYYMFDMISIEEFWSKRSSTLLTDRLEVLKNHFLTCSSKNLSFSNYFSVVKQSRVSSEEELMNFAHQAHSLGWEGLILRKNAYYEGKRSNNMLKVKKFQEKEFICLKVNKSSMTIKRDGKQVEVNVIGSITVDIGEGNTVDVGTGFSLAEKERYFEHPEEIIGKDITVSFMEYSYDKTGKPSLRFPSFKCLYESKKRDI